MDLRTPTGPLQGASHERLLAGLRATDATGSSAFVRSAHRPEVTGASDIGGDVLGVS